MLLRDARARLAGAGASPIQALAQVDTYFTAARGRLKLRETTPTGGSPTAELIAYARPDDTGPRWSAYRRVPVTPGDAAALKAALAESVGVLAVVAKTRDIACWRATRVHLDRVDGLGAFIELETVMAGQTDAEAGAELAEAAALLGLGSGGDAPIGGSYADLVLAAREPGDRAMDTMEEAAHRS